MILGAGDKRKQAGDSLPIVLLHAMGRTQIEIPLRPSTIAVKVTGAVIVFLTYRGSSIVAQDVASRTHDSLTNLPNRLLLNDV